MKKNRIMVLLLALIFVSFNVSLTSVSAAEEGSSSGFSKRVKHPDNQITDGEALNLLMKPGQKQKVAVEIENYGDKETTIEVKLNGARTSGAGSLEYGPNKFKKDKTMKYDLSDLVKVPKEVVIPAKEKKDLILDISMPDVAYKGIVTGGIQLMEKDKGVDTKKDDGTMITNKFAFLFGVTLQMDKKEVAPNFELRKAYAGLSNYRNSMIVDIANVQPKKATDMTLNVDITKKGKQDTLYTRKKNDVSMAPNSILTFAVGLDGDTMKSGNYTAHVLLKGYDKEWKWEEDFTVTDEEADKFNKGDVYVVQERGLDWKLIIIIVIVILLLIVIIALIVKKMKENKNKKTSKRKKSSK